MSFLKLIIKRVSGAVCVMLGGAIMFIGCLPVMLAASVAMGGGNEGMGGIPMGYLLLGILIGAIISFAIGLPIFSIGKSLLTPTADELRNWDRRAPVSYLRSFSDDGAFVEPDYSDAGYALKYSSGFAGPLGIARQTETFEDLMAKNFKRIGPVIAIAAPEMGGLPPTGAARLPSFETDNQWKAAVASMIQESAAVLVIAGLTQGLLWELAALIHAGALDKTWIVFPPPNELMKQDRTLERYHCMRTIFEQCGMTNWPEKVGKDLMLIRFKDSVPQLIDGKKNREQYQKILRVNFAKRCQVKEERLDNPDEFTARVNAFVDEHKRSDRTSLEVLSDDKNTRNVDGDPSLSAFLATLDTSEKT